MTPMIPPTTTTELTRPNPFETGEHPGIDAAADAGSVPTASALFDALLRLPILRDLSPYQARLLRYWMPAIITGLVIWGLFVTVGQTPLLRATGLALTVIGVVLTLRRLGSVLAIIGGLTLALCPAFWVQQTGGGASTPATIVLALGVAMMFGALIVAASRRPYIALTIALTLFTVVFVALFLSQVGVARSLRLTVFASAWLIYMLVNAILETNPRPEGPPRAVLKAQYRAGILLLYGLGVINDPLFVLFAPTLILGLALSQTRIPWWYWALMVAFTALGVYGVTTQYLNPNAWGFSALRLMERNRHVPFLVANGWSEPLRWVHLFSFLIQQFTPLGLVLAVIGMSRLSRWYPVLGSVIMLAYAGFFAFGLVYFGRDRDVLLLPLLIIHTIWMTYAVYALSQWVSKSIPADTGKGVRLILRWLATALYALLPLLLLLNILTA